MKVIIRYNTLDKDDFIDTVNNFVNISIKTEDKTQEFISILRDRFDNPYKVKKNKKGKQ